MLRLWSIDEIVDIHIGSLTIINLGGLLWILEALDGIRLSPIASIATFVVIRRGIDLFLKFRRGSGFAFVVYHLWFRRFILPGGCLRQFRLFGL